MHKAEGKWSWWWWEHCRAMLTGESCTLSAESHMAGTVKEATTAWNSRSSFLRFPGFPRASLREPRSFPWAFTTHSSQERKIPQPWYRTLGNLESFVILVCLLVFYTLINQSLPGLTPGTLALCGNLKCKQYVGTNWFIMFLFSASEIILMNWTV